MKQHDIEEKLLDAGFTKNTSYEIFMLCVSLLSLINLVLVLFLKDGNSHDVINIVGRIIGIIFIVDFLRRITGARDKKRYLFKQYGWADLLAAVPLATLNVFRVFRVFRFSRFMHKLGVGGVGKMLVKKLADTALYAVFFLILLLLEFGSIGVLLAEQNAATANIHNASDAIWWVFVSITTVGYGDRFPVTDTGRLIGVITITIGVGLFGVATGYVANAFMGSKNKAD